jgi:hypothetical protein
MNNKVSSAIQRIRAHFILLVLRFQELLDQDGIR